MKTLLLVVLPLLFSIKTNAQLLPGLLTTTSATPTSSAAVASTSSTLAATSSSATSASTAASHTSSTTSSTSTTSLSTSTSPATSTTPSVTLTSPLVTSIDGSLVTTVTVVAPSSSTSSSQAAPSSSTPPPSNSGSGGLSTGSIIGLSVAGGVAVIGLIAFFVWKLTRKRFSDFDDGRQYLIPQTTSSSLFFLKRRSYQMARFKYSWRLHI
jgi:hypothetical protein